MNDTPIHAIYGEIPRLLLDVPADAQQFSPLMPGSAQMKTLGEKTVASFVVHAPPSTLERRYVLARALTITQEGKPFTAFALKDKGGSRIAEELKHFGCAVIDDAKSHYRIIRTTRPAVLMGTEEAITAGGPQQHAALQLYTHPGVFSWDRLDAGSALLLQHLPALSGAGADLGCGIGILSIDVLKSPAVTALTLVDLDRRAVEMAKKNISDPRASFRWADMRDSELPARNLDFVVMNPPFHDTGIEDKSLGQVFITRAAAMLKPGGSLWLTANRHLPYETLLKQHFSAVELIAETDLYKIMKGVK